LPPTPKPEPETEGLSQLELNRIATPRECERLSSLSWDTLERQYPEHVIRLSDRRKGMRVKHALMVGTE